MVKLVLRKLRKAGESYVRNVTLVGLGWVGLGPQDSGYESLIYESFTLTLTFLESCGG